MQRAVLVLSVLLLSSVTGASAGLAPGRTVIAPTPVSSLSIAHRSVVYAVTANVSRTRCAYLELWDTSSRGLWRFGESTTRVCEEGPSTGSGIAAVATSGRRVFWLTYVGGNTREVTLWTATATRRSPRRLADGASDVDSDERPIVLGDGTREGVAYAVGKTVTYVADNGARIFRTELPAAVRLLTAGLGPGSARVAAALVDGRVVTISGSGAVLATAQYASTDVVALRLALPGAIVQAGDQIRVGNRTIGLPSNALMLDYARNRIVYARGAQVRSRHVESGADTLLRTVPPRAGKQPLFSMDAWGSAWASGSTVSWRSGPLG